MLNPKHNIFIAESAPPAGGVKRWTIEINSGFSPSCMSIATKVIGTLQAILSLMALILFASYIEHPHELIKMMSMADPSIVPNLPALKIVLIILVVLAFLQFTFSIMIVFGAEMNQPRLLLPWLIFNPIILVSYAITVLVAIALHSDEYKTQLMLRHLFFSTLITLVVAYKTFIVYSLYRHFKRLNF